MKILISINALQMGGGQLFAIRLANFLSKDHEVILYDHEPTRRDEKIYGLVAAGVRKISFLNNRLERIIYNKIIRRLPGSEVIIRYLRIIKFRYYTWREKPDIINSHIIGSDVIAGRGKGPVPVVVSSHGCYEDLLLKEPGSSAGLSALLKHYDGFIYAADKNIALFDPHMLSRVRPRKIYYGLPAAPAGSMTRDMFGMSEADFVFGMAARSIPSKGWEEAIAAFGQLQRTCPDRRLHFFILANETDYFFSLKQKHADNKSLHFIGYVADTLAWIPLFDVALLPTYFPGESLPNAIIEYLACGKPIVTSEIGEIPSMITDVAGNKAGIVVPLNEQRRVHPGLLYQAMHEMLTDDQARNAMQRTARAAFVQFHMDTCADQYIRYFSEVISRQRPQ